MCCWSVWPLICVGNALPASASGRKSYIRMGMYSTTTNRMRSNRARLKIKALTALRGHSLPETTTDMETCPPCFESQEQFDRWLEADNKSNHYCGGKASR